MRKFLSSFLAAAMLFAAVSCSPASPEVTGIPAASSGVRETTSYETTAPAETTVSQEELVNERAAQILSQMTLEQKVQQMMFVSFRSPELSDAMISCLEEYSFGGFIMFGQNAVDLEQTMNYISAVQTANQNGGGIPMLISVDQEGGAVSHLSFATTGVGNMALAATGDPEQAYAMAYVHGSELDILGINTDFAPVLDINNNPNNPVIGVRSFSDDPEVVSDFGLAYIDGLTFGGVIATLKHFPGHGNTDTDSHTGFPCINSTYEELQQFELVPFQAAIDAGAEMIMTAHIQYPQIETGTYISTSTGEEVCLPATMSRTILTDILRGDMGFDGVVVTDALEMDAISENFAREDVIVMAINAGADMLMLPFAYDDEGLQKIKDWADMALALVEEGRIDEARVDEAVTHILRLKINHGIIDQTYFEVLPTAIENASVIVGGGANQSVEERIAYDALTLYQNNGAFPLQMEEGDSVLVIFSDSCASKAGTAELVRQTLIEQGVIAEDTGFTVMTDNEGTSAQCLAAAQEATHVILVNAAVGASVYVPGTFDQIIQTRHDAGQSVIFISSWLPYDAVRFPDADAVLLTYGSSAVTLTDDAVEAPSYMPNLFVAFYSCFGIGEPGGEIPVSEIPVSVAVPDN